VLFTSGYTQNSIVHNGELDRGVSLLSKPWRTEELARQLRSVLDQAHASRPARALRVLLVRRDPLLRVATAAMLADLGHDVAEAGTGAEALSRLLHGVDLMICDDELMDVDGLALVELVRKRLPGTPAILAGGSEPGGRHDVVWLDKPYDAAALQAALSQVATACDRAA